MSDRNPLPRSFTARGDSGVLHTIVRTAGDTAGGREPHYALRDGSRVVALEDGRFRIEATGELLIPSQ